MEQSPEDSQNKIKLVKLKNGKNKKKYGETKYF